MRWTGGYGDVDFKAVGRFHSMREFKQEEDMTKYLVKRSVFAHVLLVCAASMLLAFGAGCDGIGGGKKLQTFEGPLLVRYSAQIDAATSFGSVPEGVRMKEIQMFDEFVLLVGEDGVDSQLLPLSKIRWLAWRKVD